jgi:uncharacterized protein YfiM (DUF2279 family)
MANEVRADPAQLCRLGDQMLTSSETIDDSWRGQQSALSPLNTAFGNTAGGQAVFTAHQDTHDSAGVAVGRFVEVLQGDMDRLYEVAFAYQQVDRNNARKFGGQGHIRDRD